MRKVSELVYDVRVITNNTNFSSTSGIADEAIINFLNDGQKRIQTLISNANSISKPFVREDFVSIVGGQEEYSLPRRLSYGKEVENVEYSYDSTAANYQLLEKRLFFNRQTTRVDSPGFYYRRFGKLYINPIPNTSTGTLRVLYESPMDDLDKRRGAIATVTGLSSTTFTSITISTDADETSTPLNLTNADYICINTKDGVVTAYNIPLGTYNTGTNVWTPAAGFTFLFAAETIVAGSFVTFGKWTTTHSKLPDELENYLVQYGAMRTFHIDSSMKLKGQSEIVDMMESEIVSQAASQTGELQLIPQLDYSEWW